MRTLQALADLNGQIARGGAGAELLDRRDALLDDLAAEIEISVYRQDNGTVGVYTRSGQVLLDRAPRQLVYEPAASGRAGHQLRRDPRVPRRRARPGDGRALGRRQRGRVWSAAACGPS